MVNDALQSVGISVILPGCHIASHATHASVDSIMFGPIVNLLSILLSYQVK